MDYQNGSNKPVWLKPKGQSHKLSPFMENYWNIIKFIKMHVKIYKIYNMDRVKRIWYLSPMRAAKVQAILRTHAVSPEPSLLAHTSSESRHLQMESQIPGSSEWLGMCS